MPDHSRSDRISRFALSLRVTTIVSVIAIVVGAILTALGGSLPVLSTGHPILAAGLLLIVVWSAWSAGWVFRHLQQVGETAAKLALAEERLRTAQDLQDVFARTLSKISVKSGLAAELSHRGHQQRAIDEMHQVREMASTAAAEVRRVVRGERRAGWADEVDGARTLLASAGIQCAIAGDEVPQRYAGTFAWVLREGVANALRYSRATQVSITTAVETDEVALSWANDGASGPAELSGGHGLLAMAERLRELGGVLEHEQDGDWFLLTASIPVPQEVPA